MTSTTRAIATEITTEDTREKERIGCSLSLDGHPECRGIMLAGIARGALNMSNVHLSNAFLHLACKEGGGFGDGDRCIDPDVRVRGMKPASFISNILVAASLVSAIMMPLTGAIIDFTPHRHWVGIFTALGLAIITGVQIGTVEETWFIMAILQAVIFVIYQLQVMTIFAYFPEIAKDYGVKKIVSYSSTWSAYQFTAQAIVNLIIILCNINFRLNTVQTARLSQGVTLFFCVIALAPGWYIMPKREPKHVLKKGRSLTIAGFQQVYNTVIKIWKHYRSLSWFLISVSFGESAALAVGNTAVIFLFLGIGLNALQIGIFFEVSLLGVILGTKSGAIVSRLTNPTISLQLASLGCALATIIGCWLVVDVEVKERTYAWGASIGFFLGWYYPVENTFFSLAVPRNQEAEFAGIYNYASQIFGWLPPLLFTVMVENDITIPWALTGTASFFFVAIFFLRLAKSWNVIVAESQVLIPNPDFDDMSEQNEEGKKDIGESASSDKNEC